MDHENCNKLLYSLSEYIDGELDSEMCAQIERHLEGCDNCRIVIDSLRKTVYLYQVTTEPASVPEDVRQRLFRRLDLDEFLGKSAPQEPGE
jgi:anti-sigma factor (TIGR02949 family)